MTDEEHAQELRRVYNLLLTMKRPQPHRALQVLDQLVKLENRLKRKTRRRK